MDNYGEMSRTQYRQFLRDKADAKAKGLPPPQIPVAASGKPATTPTGWAKFNHQTARAHATGAAFPQQPPVAGLGYASQGCSMSRAPVGGGANIVAPFQKSNEGEMSRTQYRRFQRQLADAKAEGRPRPAMPVAAHGKPATTPTGWAKFNHQTAKAHATGSPLPKPPPVAMPRTSHKK